MKFFRLLLASGFCLLCIFSIGTPIEASTITIEPLDINWRPRADSDCSTDEEKEKTYANVTITLQNVDFPTDPNSEKLPYVKVFLSEVTEWKGICGNDSDSEYSTLPSHLENDDLVLERTDSHNSEWYKNYRIIDGYEQYDGTLSRTLGRNDSSISVKVSCKDYGAFGKITATLYDYGGAGDYKSKDSNTVRIPRDDNKNKIADIWEDKSDVNLTAAEKEDVELDVETGPGDANTNDGDGLSIFAEYRGFKLYKYSRSRWQYTSPREKDIFVSWAHNMSDYKAGDASKLPSPLKVNLVSQSYVNNPNGLPDLDTTRWLNFNNERIPGHKKVYAIDVRQSNTPPDSAGNNSNRIVFGRTPHYGPPNYNSVAIIYINNVRAEHPNDFATAIKNVIAHEIGHNINLDDCPVDPCPHAGENGNFCFMDCERDRTSSSTIYGVAHNPDYDAHPRPPNGNRQPKHDTQCPENAVPAGDGNSDESSSGVTSADDIISTNTGPSSYGCDHNAEHDYCTDTGTCGSATDSSTNGLCGHRWCICPAASTSGDAMAACGIHAASASGDHTSTYVCNTPPCSNRVVPSCLALCPETSSHGTTTITRACGHTYTSSDSNSHSLQASCSYTDRFGDGCSITNFYACDNHVHYIPTALLMGACNRHYVPSRLLSNHALQSSCSVTNANGDTCTVTNFYPCQTHTHAW